MLRKIPTILLAGGLILALGISSLVLANPKADKQRRLTEKVKVEILNLGTRPEARVQVKLRDKTKLPGFIGEANDESFVVTDNRSAATRRVAYPMLQRSREIIV